MWRDDPSSDSVFFLKMMRYTLSSKRNQCSNKKDCYRPCFPLFGFESMVI
nr:MAG TPA: hypothetical protein [Caudoviricetes sp.]